MHTMLCYQSPLQERDGKRQALEELKAKSGTQFDPLVVNTFINILNE